MDQIAASGTSVGANTFEADEAMSRKDFCKALGIANKELNETRFWLRLFVRREWTC
jgi:four helix bundle protein